MYHFLVKTALPFCLHLKDDVYEILCGGKKYSIKTNKIWSNFASGSDQIDDYEDDENRTPIGITFRTPSFSDSITDFIHNYTGKNIEYIDDDTDHFRKTVIQIQWESEQDYLAEAEKNRKVNLDEVYSELLLVVNKFLEIYRINSGEFYLPLLKEIPFRNFSSLTNLDTGLSQALFSTGIRKAPYNISKEKHEKLKEDLLKKNVLDSTTLSLNSAKHWLYKSQFRNSILDSIIALEPVVYSIVEDLWRRLGISNRKIKNQIGKVDLNYLMTIEVPNVININDENIKLIYDDVLKAITIRNKIVHTNLKNISEKDASDSIHAVEKLISLINSNLYYEGNKA